MRINPCKTVRTTKESFRDRLAVARQHGLERHRHFTNGHVYARNGPRIALTGTARLHVQAANPCRRDARRVTFSPSARRTRRRSTPILQCQKLAIRSSRERLKALKPILFSAVTTHLPMVRKIGHKTFANPGSVASRLAAKDPGPTPESGPDNQ